MNRDKYQMNECLRAASADAQDAIELYRAAIINYNERNNEPQVVVNEGDESTECPTTTSSGEYDEEEAPLCTYGRPDPECFILAWFDHNEKYFENPFRNIELVYRRFEYILYSDYLCMEDRQFQYLVKNIGHFRNTVMVTPNAERKFMSNYELLALVFQFLTRGTVPSVMRHNIAITDSHFLEIICDVCYSLYWSLKSKYLVFPRKEKHWASIQNEFRRLYRLSECLGIVSMRRVIVNAEQMGAASNVPLIMSSIMDARNNFIYADVERCDSHPFYFYKNSSLRQKLEHRILKVTGCNILDCHFHYFIARSVLPIKTYMMTSYLEYPVAAYPLNPFSPNNTPVARFCCAIDRACSQEQKTFDALSHMFPILKKLPPCVTAANARKIILGCVALYNYFRRNRPPNAPFQNTGEREIFSLDDSEEVVLPANTTCFAQIPFQIGKTASGMMKRDAIKARF